MKTLTLHVALTLFLDYSTLKTLFEWPVKHASSLKSVAPFSPNRKSKSLYPHFFPTVSHTNSSVFILEEGKQYNDAPYKTHPTFLIQYN